MAYSRAVSVPYLLEPVGWLIPEQLVSSTCWNHMKYRRRITVNPYYETLISSMWYGDVYVTRGYQTNITTSKCKPPCETDYITLLMKPCDIKVFDTSINPILNKSSTNIYQPQCYIHPLQ